MNKIKKSLEKEYSRKVPATIVKKDSPILFGDSIIRNNASPMGKKQTAPAFANISNKKEASPKMFDPLRG